MDGMKGPAGEQGPDGRRVSFNVIYMGSKKKICPSLQVDNILRN